MGKACFFVSDSPAALRSLVIKGGVFLNHVAGGNGPVFVEALDEAGHKRGVGVAWGAVLTVLCGPGISQGSTQCGKLRRDQKARLADGMTLKSGQKR